MPPTGQSKSLGCTLAILLSLAGLMLAATQALAAGQTVTASGITFVDKEVTIVQGDTVTWTNGGGSHNVHFDDDSFDMPSDPASNAWTVNRTFGQVGTYGYYCELHVGVGMSGTVHVNAGGPSPPGPGPPSPLPPGPGGPLPGGGDSEPVSSLSGPSTQDVDKLYVRASMNEAGALTATATVNVPEGAARVHRFRPVTRTVKPNVAVKLRLELSRKSLRAVKRGLRRKRLRAKVTVSAKDSAGNGTTRKRTIRLTR